MPTYDYHCSACNTDFEQFQSMKDDPLSTCPKCKKKGKVKRLISAGAGIIFKGSGFYETDYKKTAEKKSGGDSKSGGESKSETKSESKSSSDSKSGGDAKPKAESKKKD